MRKRIGEFLLEKGVLNASQITQVLRHGEATGLRFGEAAQDLGLLSREKLVEIFGPSFAIDFFHLEPQYFPVITKDLLTPDFMLKQGVLALGFKTERKLFKTRKVLNLGLLDPSRNVAAVEALQAASEKTGEEEAPEGVKVYLVLADQFLQILNDVYGMSAEAIRGRAGREGVDGVLSMFLEKG